MEKDITEIVKTYEDACVETGTNPVDESEMIKAGFTPDEIAYRKLKTIAKALNEGWAPNWDEPEYKYWPLFCMVGGGAHDGAYAGASPAHSDDVPSFAYAYFGSRLCFKSRRLATYAGNQFIKLWDEFISQKETN
jgi:hypothetical protein